MVGFPGETKEQIMKTIGLASDLNFDDYYISIVTPLPGTNLYDQCDEQGLFHDDFDVENLRYSVSNIKLTDMSRDAIENLRRDIWLKSTKDKLDQKSAMDSKNKFKVFKETEEYEKAGFNEKDIHLLRNTGEEMT